MVVPVIVLTILAVAVLAVVVLGMTDWWEIMFLAGMAALMFGMYKGTI